jgi:ankyrin repeat protein
VRRVGLAAAWLTLAGCAHAATPACVEFETKLPAALARGLSSLEINNLLFEAARKGCAATLPQLFDAGASRLARDRDGDTALGLAARAGRDEIVATLLAGAAETERRQIDMADARGATPLMLALHAGREAVAQRLIDAGAAVDAADQQGETALSEAAFAGQEALGEALLRKGATPDTRDRYGKTPICYAAARGAAGLVGALLDAGVDPNARYGGDLTALMWAAGSPDMTATERAPATVKTLIARGAKLDLVDDRGRSALMIAAGLNRFETARALLEAGASKTLRDKGGLTAADLAATPEMRALAAP